MSKWWEWGCREREVVPPGAVFPGRESGESALEAQFLLPASLSCAGSQAVALSATVVGGGEEGEGNSPPLLSSSIK